MKILIVDDTPTNIDILVEYLSETYDLLVALDGLQALEILETEVPDLILLDIMMPNLDGYETCLKIKENMDLEKIPIIFLTANSDENSIKRAYEVGGVDFISKPIILVELNARINVHLQLSQHSTSLESKLQVQTSMVKEKSDALIKKLHYDDNTGLGNLILLENDLKELNYKVIYLIDIDNFSYVNKLHGLSFGNKLLLEISNIFQQILPLESKLYKLNVDRFVLLSKDQGSSDIDGICNSIFYYFDSNKINLDEIGLDISTSIGISYIKDNEDSLVNAEYALEMAKSKGKRYKFLYNEDNDFIEDDKETIKWMGKIREFIKKEALVPFYQKIVDVNTGKTYKYEALARIISGDKILPPNKFLDAAERMGILSSITQIMIEKVFKYFQNTKTRFSINITHRDLTEGYLINYLYRLSNKYNIDPTNVTLEILENITLVNDNNVLLNCLNEIKDLGFKIAIDDFGSENANLSRILSLNVDYIKIDAIFIKDIDKDLEKQKVVYAIVQLAKELNIKTVAEFVSSEEIFNTVKKLGIDYAQGFYLAKPVESIK